MLSLRGSCAATVRCINFPDSAWLVDVPPPTALRAEASPFELDVLSELVRGLVALYYASLAQGLLVESQPPASSPSSRSSKSNNEKKVAMGQQGTYTF
jgi:hypothetical protein